MAKLYKYGIHDGIKYNPRCTQFRLCIICGQPFFDIPPRSKKQVCSEECAEQRKRLYDFKNKKELNDKWNPIHNKKKLEDPEQRRKHNQLWLDWYRNLRPDQRKKYNDKKKMGSRKKKRQDGPQVSTESELDALYAELGLTRK